MRISMWRYQPATAFEDGSDPSAKACIIDTICYILYGSQDLILAAGPTIKVAKAPARSRLQASVLEGHGRMLSRLEDGFVRFNRWLVGAMMMVMFALVFTNVVTRYGFGFSIAWAEEVSRFLMIWVAFLGAGLALREGRHVAIEVLQDLLGERKRLVLRWSLFVLIAAFAALLVYLGVAFSRFGWDKETMVTQIPRGIPYLAIPVGMAFFLIHLLLIRRRFLLRDWQRDDGGLGEGVEGGDSP